jgi:hypothetical protein
MAQPESFADLVDIGPRPGRRWRARFPELGQAPRHDRRKKKA